MIAHDLALGLALLALSTHPLELDQAQEAAEAAAEIEPRAERILWHMGEYLKGAGAFQFHADALVDEAHPSGQWVQVSRSMDVALHRERGLRASVQGDLVRREFWCDLETAALLDSDAGMYSLVEVPETLDGVLDHLLEEYGVSWPLADLCYSDPFVTLVEGVELGVYVGRHRVGDNMCHHLAFRHETVDWQIWVDAGVHPVPRKVSITHRATEGAPRFTATLSGWDLEPYLPEAVFEFQAPEGAELVELESVRVR